jgi:Uma2 family endonuclease
MGTQALLTLEQFDQLPIVEGVGFELDEGVVVTIPERTPRRNLVGSNIGTLLWDFAHPKGFGHVWGTTGYQLSHDTVRIPDVSFVPAERMRGLDLDRRILGAPALAVEVVSPTDLAGELAHKVDQYLAAGVRVVWVVYPNAREIHVFRQGGMASVLGPDDMLEAPDLLPGFAVRVGELFE